MAKMEGVNSKWGEENPKLCRMVANWFDWDLSGWDIRNNLMEWMNQREVDQMADDAEGMMDDMEDVLGTKGGMKSEMKEGILVGITEVLIEVVKMRNKKVGAYDMCGRGELCQAQHNCDNITLDITGESDLEEDHSYLEGTEDEDPRLVKTVGQSNNPQVEHLEEDAEPLVDEHPKMTNQPKGDTLKVPCTSEGPASDGTLHSHRGGGG